MRPAQKKFLWVAVPFFAVAVGALLVSVWASVVVTMAGLACFAWLFSHPTGRSLALAPCVLCARKIIFEHEGDFCATCNEPLHAKCMDEHRMAAHAPPRDQPFR